jgi:hypothetical protein
MTVLPPFSFGFSKQITDNCFIQIYHSLWWLWGSDPTDSMNLYWLAGAGQPAAADRSVVDGNVSLPWSRNTFVEWSWTAIPTHHSPRHANQTGLKVWMVPKKKLCKHNTHTLLVANVRTEQLGSHGIFFHQTDLPRQPHKCYTITPFLHCKNKTTHSGSTWVGLGLYLNLHQSLCPTRTQTEYEVHLSYNSTYSQLCYFPTHTGQVNSTIATKVYNYSRDPQNWKAGSPLLFQ